MDASFDTLYEELMFRAKLIVGKHDHMFSNKKEEMYNLVGDFFLSKTYKNFNSKKGDLLNLFSSYADRRILGKRDRVSLWLSRHVPVEQDENYLFVYRDRFIEQLECKEKVEFLKKFLSNFTASKINMRNVFETCIKVVEETGSLKNKRFVGLLLGVDERKAKYLISVMLRLVQRVNV